MSLFKKNNKKGTMHAIFETDDLEQARYVAKNFSDVSVEYHDIKREIPLLLHFKTNNGRIISKYNPDYVQYLKRKFPEMSENEIYNYMSQKIEEMKQEENKASGKKR